MVLPPFLEGLYSFLGLLARPGPLQFNFWKTLARASYNKEPIEQLQLKIRHTYDLYHLLQMPEIQAFVASPEFFETLRAVQMDDAKNSEFQGSWSAEPLSGALIYRDDTGLWPKLEGTYTGAFKGLVYGQLPALADVRQALQQLAERLKIYDAMSPALPTLESTADDDDQEDR